MTPLILGDCLDVLRAMPDASVDAVVTDPPYGISFMGREWDKTPDGRAFAAWAETWARECLRLLKPGGHMLAFGGTRMFHRLTCGVEDAGFEIRDCLSWLYGTGFPKSLDVSKAIDKAGGAERTVIGRYELPDVADGRRLKGWECKNETDAGMFGVTGQSLITAPATDAAKAWSGWGTALKPAWEPIVLARKPLIGTVAANVQAHGTGGINIDACRIASGGPSPSIERRKHAAPRDSVGSTGWTTPARPPSYNQQRQGETLGRWPANVVLDEEAAAMLDQQTGDLGLSAETEVAGNAHPNGIYGARVKTGVGAIGFGDRGGPSRFFYTAKASSAERELEDSSRSTHPTVKPVDLMRWLVRLVTPPGGVVLDPFMGSGSTGVACAEEGLRFIGIEREAEYHAIAVKRLDAATRQGRLDL